MSKSPARRPNKKGPAPAPRRAGAAVAAYVPSTVDAASSGVNSTGAALVRDIGLMIESARNQVAQAANAALTTLYWQIGHRVRQDVLKERRAEYGAQIVATVGRQLAVRFGRGFDEKSLRRMLQFAESFPEREIVAALQRQLGWTHFKVLLPLKEPLKREFYAEMCRVEGWSTRVLAQKIWRTSRSEFPQRKNRS